jgi:hypothetical protein
MVVAGADGPIYYWSRGAQELTGHAAATAVGSSLDLIVPPDSRERHWAGFRAAMDSGAARFEGAAANIPVLCADGRCGAGPAGSRSSATPAATRPGPPRCWFRPAQATRRCLTCECR